MDLVNDLSTDLAVAVFVEGALKRKLEAQDAKSFIALVEQELERISLAASPVNPSDSPLASSADLSH